MTPLSIEAHFDLSNACTGCAIHCCSDNTKLYVNKNMEIETWNKKKGNRDSLQRTSTRVELMVKDKIEQEGVEHDTTFNSVASSVLTELSERPLTKKDLESILKIIHHADKSPPGSITSHNVDVEEKK